MQTTNSYQRRPRLTVARADTRRAVRSMLARLAVEDPHNRLVMVALSGGPDSLALAAASSFEASRNGWSAGAIIIDHNLQEGSATVAENAADTARRLGLDPVIVTSVRVPESSQGTEAAARAARYEALAEAAKIERAHAVLVGHTRDDQAETVLLGLARGSGPASLSGMPDVWRVNAMTFARPLLNVSRRTTHDACSDEGIEVWHDPHNLDPRFARVRVRTSILPQMERELGPGVTEALARTATLLRDDHTALDAMASARLPEIATHSGGETHLSIELLLAEPAALHRRIIRSAAARDFDSILSHTHTLAVCDLLTDWHGQKPLDLPNLQVLRAGGMLVLRSKRLG